MSEALEPLARMSKESQATMTEVLPNERQGNPLDARDYRRNEQESAKALAERRERMTQFAPLVASSR